MEVDLICKEVWKWYTFFHELLLIDKIENNRKKKKFGFPVYNV